MSEHRNRQEKALRQYRAGEAEWTSTEEQALEPVRLTVEEAELIIQRYGGRDSLSEGVEHLAAALELLAPVLRDDTNTWRRLLHALNTADHACERAMDAEAALTEAGLRSQGGEVIVRQDGPGRKPRRFRLEVEREFLAVAAEGGEDPEWMTNGRTLHDAISRRLAGRYPADQLQPEKIKRAVQSIQDAMRG